MRNIFIKHDPTAFDGSAYIMGQINDTALTNHGTTLMTPLTIPDCDSLPGRYVGCSPIWVQEVSKEISGLEIYPNPVNDKLYVVFYANNSCSGSIEIYDVIGNK